jgi:hypothetical protein
VIPPQRRAPRPLVPSDFALYDGLNCSAQAIKMAGDPGKAEAWIAAATAARGMLAPEAASALTVLTVASAPGRGPQGRPELLEALNAASLAVLFAMPGAQPGLLDEVLPDARAAAARLRAILPDCGAALEAILDGPRADAGVTA